jgi:phospholipase C
MHHQQGRYREKRSADVDLPGTKERHAGLTTRATVRRLAFAAAAALAASACSSGADTEHTALVPFSLHAAAVAPDPAVPIGKYIKHVVIIVQENRTLNSFFAGYPGADTVMTGYSTGGVQVALKAVTFDGPDINHEWTAAMADWDKGKMDGFDRSLAYGYMQRGLVAPYWSMAKQYVLADHMFPTEFGPSFTAHLDLIASTANLTPSEAEVDVPDGDWRCNAAAGTRTSLITSTRVYEALAGPFPCFTQFNTMAQVLDKAHVSWKYYAPAAVNQLSWSAFDTIKYVWDGPDWRADVVSPQTAFLKAAAQGNLAGVTWIVPDFIDSDHAGSMSDTGPSWVSAIVNTIGKSSNWGSTAIVVVWDDWGGWYDNVPPPQKDFAGLGIRVPCLIISPYSKNGAVVHTQYEFGSILKFVEQTFSLPPIGNPAFGYTDSRSNSLVDSFNFTQKPRAYVKIPAKYPISHFLNEKPSNRLPDDI